MSLTGVVWPLFSKITLSSTVSVAVLTVVSVPLTVRLPEIVTSPVTLKSWSLVVVPAAIRNLAVVELALLRFKSSS